MRITERLRGFRDWAKTNLCDERQMKAPGEGLDITHINWREPSCYLGWEPTKMDKNGLAVSEAAGNVCPGILIMPNPSYAKRMEEKRFDRYNNVHRPPDMAQHFAVSILFSVYEPGIRLPGFVTRTADGGKKIDPDKFLDGTEQGLFTLLDWMDDCQQFLLRDSVIPNTDMILEEDSLMYSLYTDQNFVVDRRPIYYGFVNASFECYANKGANGDVNNLLL